MKYKPKKENIEKMDLYLKLLIKTKKDGKLCNK